MRSAFPFQATRACKPAGAVIGKVASDERGTTAIEFAAVIGPFMFLLFGIMSVGFYFFVVFSLEHAIETASRVIRTGQAQTQTPAAMTVAQFKDVVCSKLPPFMNCNGTGNKLRVNVQSFTNYHGVAASCVDNSGALIAANTQTFDTGSASSVVLATVCYEWDLSQAMATVVYWISPSSARMTNGGTLVRASTTFTTEPYN